MIQSTRKAGLLVFEEMDYEAKTDAELVALVRGGQREAFGVLVERYEAMVLHIAAHMVANEEVARELAQEAVLAAYLSLAQLHEATRFRSWLYGIALNVCRSYLRERKSDPYSLEALMGGMRCDPAVFLAGTIDPQQAAEERELQHAVLAAVWQLPAKERAATLLFYYEQLSMEEIARVSGASVNAVKGRLHRARKNLRVQLFPLYRDMDAGMEKTEEGGKIGKTGALQAEGSKKMIPARIHSVREISENGQTVVALQDEAGRRVVLIWVGKNEGLAIAMGITGLPSPRPITASLMADLLKATGVQLEEVRIEALKDDVFYAVIKVRNGESVQEMDARPSDALALAAHMSNSVPIFIAEDVMERCAVTVPEGKALRGGNADLQAARESVQKKLEEMYSAFSTIEAVKQRTAYFKSAEQILIDDLTEEQ